MRDDIDREAMCEENLSLSHAVIKEVWTFCSRVLYNLFLDVRSCVGRDIDFFSPLPTGR